MTAERLLFPAASNTVFGRLSASLPAIYIRIFWIYTVKPAAVPHQSNPDLYPPRTVFLVFDSGSISLYQSIFSRFLETVRSPISKIPEIVFWTNNFFKKRFSPRNLLFQFYLCYFFYQTVSQYLLWKISIYPRYTGPGI